MILTREQLDAMQGEGYTDSFSYINGTGPIDLWDTARAYHDAQAEVERQSKWADAAVARADDAEREVERLREKVERRLREAWAEVEHWKEQHLAGDTPFLRDRAEKAEAAIARVRAICTRADNDEFHSPYQVAEFIRDALDGEACPFCTREAQAECESTGGRCSEEDEIDAVLDDRPDLDAHEALIAGLREARAEVERLDRDARAVAGAATCRGCAADRKARREETT